MIRRPRQQSPAHLAFLRALPSLVPGDGPVEAAHIRYADLRYFKPLTGLGEKPHDKFAVPLAASAHRDQHAGNERQWWANHAIDPILIAALLWLHSGDIEAGEHIVRTARNWTR
ncbi:MAG: hypothetical protein P4M09_07715 [Devosia sp.]|nr:hypothetical protein [Devosia sp.]